MTEHATFRTACLPPGEPVEGKTYRADGWAYVDMPSWSTLEWWSHAREVFGEGEYVVLAESTRGIHWRGQFLVSPAAIDRFRAFMARRRGTLN